MTEYTLTVNPEGTVSLRAKDGRSGASGTLESIMRLLRETHPHTQHPVPMGIRYTGLGGPMHVSCSWSVLYDAGSAGLGHGGNGGCIVQRMAPLTSQDRSK